MERHLQPAETDENSQSPSATFFMPLDHGYMQDSPSILGRRSRLVSSPIVMDLHEEGAAEPAIPIALRPSVHNGHRYQPLALSPSITGVDSSELPRLSTNPVTPARPMDLHDLEHLRDWLVKTAAGGGSINLANPRVSVTRDSVARNSNVDRPSLGPLDMSHLSSFRQFMKAKSSRGYARQDSDRPMALTATGRLPHESVAVLIDAMRGSRLRANDKCRFLFELFDVEKKGSLSREGVADFIEATFLASNLRVYGALQIQEIVDRLFQHTADPNMMTYNEFCLSFGTVVDAGELSTLLGTQGTTDSALLDSLAEGASPPKSARFPLLKKASGWCRRVTAKFRKHDSEIVYFTLYVLVLVAVFMIKAHYIAYDPAVGYSAKIAKGCAQIVMVNTLFLLLPMCRNFVTFLRRFAAISSRVPLDQHIEFHKICGVVMLLASLGHTIAWVFIVYYLRTVSQEVWEKSHYARLPFVREESIVGLLSRIPMWTGVIMLQIGLIAGPLTISKVRRGNFNVFWLTHLLFVPFLLLIVIHGLAMWVQPPQAYFWVLPPIVLYGIEKRYRVTNVFGGRTTITRVKFSQDTAAIYMEKPEGFHYHPGMYLFLNVPAVSRFEWHPFTISSAPEDDFLSVHIRNAGDWTGALHKKLRTAQESIAMYPMMNDVEAGGTHEITSERLIQDIPYPPVFIDGPVGAPSQDYYRYESVVFVGAGIGVTPFASILQSIVHQWQAYRCDTCKNVKLPKTFKLKKIYFYWITREQEALTWFAEAMNQLSAMDSEGRLEIHNYFSPLKRESVIAPLHALQRLVHRADGHDIITGLATKQVTHFGRPDWKLELERIADQQDGVGTIVKRQIGVFFCGPKPMGNEIHSQCAAYNDDKDRRRPTVSYAFHSENF